jgi:hypothetical protein
MMCDLFTSSASARESDQRRLFKFRIRRRERDEADDSDDEASVRRDNPDKFMRYSRRDSGRLPLTSLSISRLSLKPAI